MNRDDRPDLICVMGVSGCGKSTLGRALADTIGAEFLEGDSFHPPSNKEKMGSGVPLTDDDREPWVRAMCETLERSKGEGRSAVLACSALRRAHRARLREAGIRVFVWLTGDPGLIRRRMDNPDRGRHYMRPAMLESQLRALETPSPGEPVVPIDIAAEPDAQLRHAIALLADARDPPS